MSSENSYFVDIYWIPKKGDLVAVEITFKAHYMSVLSNEQQIENFDIFYGNIDRSDRYSLNGSYSTVLYLKDLRIFTFRVSLHCDRFHDLIERSMSSINIDGSKPFAFTYKNENSGKDVPAQEMVDLKTELTQMTTIHSKLRISTVNVDYKICPFYPELVVVPKATDDSVISAIYNLRGNKCFPICVYVNPKNKAMLIRSAQPLISRKRQYMDEVRFLNAFSPNVKNWSIDLRSLSDIRNHEQLGGGREIQEYCPFWKILVVSMEKASKLISKFDDVVKASSDTNKFYSRAVDSGWLFSISFVMELAVKIVKKLQKDFSAVHIHGKSSTCRAVLVTSLVMIMADPEFRTFSGFQRLIVREWHWGAFQFSNRTKSVIFVIFLDCVWQMMQQFPTIFEFNERLLLLLFCHSRFSRFGTFLGRSEHQRAIHDIPNNTKSIWPYITENYMKYSNICFKPCDLIVDDLNLQDLKIWACLYGRSDQPFVMFSYTMNSVVDENVRKVRSLEQQVESLKRVEDLLSNSK